MQTGKEIAFVVYSHLTFISLLLAVNMEVTASVATPREAVNKNVDDVFAIVSRPPMDPGPPREPGKYVTIDDGLNPIFELPPSLCETPQVGHSLQDEPPLLLTAG
jgi:hypothetical protein